MEKNGTGIHLIHHTRFHSLCEKLLVLWSDNIQREGLINYQKTKNIQVLEARLNLPHNFLFQT